MPYLFSYGTLQSEAVQMTLFGRALNASTDVLKGYRIAHVEVKDRVFLLRGEQAIQLTVVPSADKSSNISGTVLELMDEDLLRADNYEPKEYKRTEVVLGSGKHAWIYVYAQVKTGYILDKDIL